MPRFLLAQLFNSEGLESLEPAELLEMLAELDDQIIDGGEVVKLSA